MQWPDNQTVLADTVHQFMGISVRASPAWRLAAPAVGQLQRTAEQHFGSLPARFWGHHIFTQLCWQGSWLTALQHAGFYPSGLPVDVPVAISQGFARGVNIYCRQPGTAPVGSLSLIALQARINLALQDAGIWLPVKEQHRLLADQLAAACRRLVALGWAEPATITGQLADMLEPWESDLVCSPPALLKPEATRLTCCRYEMASQQYCAGCPKARRRQQTGT